jgi:hypothetical protein
MRQYNRTQEKTFGGYGTYSVNKRKRVDHDGELLIRTYGLPVGVI